EMLRAHARERPPSLRSRGAKVPPALDAIVLRLLEKEPDARWKTGNDVIRALNAALGVRFALETDETAASYILSPRFVGRADELATLAAWARATARVEAPRAHGGSYVPLSFDDLGGTDEKLAPAGAAIEEGAAPGKPVERAPRVVLVRGESGSGKSRLLREL